MLRGVFEGNREKNEDVREQGLPGVIGGDPQVDQSRAAISTGWSVSLASTMPSMPSRPSRPENMGFMGVCSMSQLLGLLMELPALDSGGVDGKYIESLRPSVSSRMVGLWLAAG
jgi:hypothetical protein